MDGTLALEVPAARRVIMNWSPVLLSTLLSLSAAVIVGVAALGQWRWAATKQWRESAEASSALVRSLQEQLEEARRDREDLEHRLESAEKKHADDMKLMEARMVTWETQVAQAQRVIYHLQQKLDESEARHAAIDARTEERNIRQHPQGD
jgi:ABC-type nickel/cobalt efflux system permease component RcnA